MSNKHLHPTSEKVSAQILDLGCGTVKRGSVGVDLERASGVDIIADAHLLPIRDCCFDGCMAYSVLEHVNAPLQVIHEIVRLLQEKGWLKVRVPRNSRLRFDTFAFFFTMNFGQLRQQYEFLRKGLHKHQYSTRSLRRIMERNGLTVYFLPFSVVRRETKNHLLVDVFEYLHNIYVVAKK